MAASHDDPRVPITLLTGFLGAGKTTVLNGLLRHPGMANAAVIVNEFGEIGLDHLLIRSADEHVVLLDSGCLCCTINNSLRETLGELWVGRVREELPRFDRVLVETTGLAEPAPIMLAITRDPFVTEHFRLDGVVTCVDAVHAPQQLETQPEVSRQVAVADRLLLTKTDLTTPDAIAELRAHLARINPAAGMLEVVRGEVEPRQVLGVGLYDTGRGTLDVERWLSEQSYAAQAHQHQHQHDVSRHGAGIQAHCFRIDHPVSWAGLAAWCELMAESHGDALLRVKGLVENAETGRPVVVHGVHRLFDRPLRLREWPGGERRGVLVVVARDLDAAYLRRTLGVLTLPSGAGRPASLAEAMS
jgi:G3E family GTPase